MPSSALALPCAVAVLAAAPAAQWPTSSLASEAFGSAKACFDEARNRLVVHAENGALWEHDGRSWARQSVTWQQGDHLLYEPCRQRVLSFGATVQAFDGTRMESLGPAPAYNAVVADRARCAVVGIRVVVAGASFSVAIDEFVHGGFVQVAAIPGSRFLGGVAYDAVSQVTWLQTQVVASFGNAEMWAWDGQQLTGPVVIPAGPGTQGIVYDPSQGRVVAAGQGVQWQWHGTHWVSVPMVGAAPARIPVADHRNGRMLCVAPDLDDWVWIGIAAQWSRGPSFPHPSCTQYTLTFDESRRRAVLLGASSAGSVRHVHAEWNGHQWDLLPLPVHGPGTLWQIAQAYDASRSEVVTFGGLGPGATQLQGDTWTWNGTAWSLAATTGPAPRSGAAMTYDSVRNRVVMIGGRDSLQGHPTLTDHWEWDGQSWQQIAASGPFASGFLLLGFDPNRNRLVAYDEYLGNTYEFVGSTWQLVGSGGIGRSPMRQLVWNPSAQTLEALFLIGSIVPHTFAWDGVSWAITGSVPMLRAYDPVGAVALAHLTTHSRVESATAASVTGYGASCGASTTTLSAFGLPRLGHGGFHVDLRTTAGQQPALVGFGLDADNLALGNGCTLLVQNVVASQIRITDPYGFMRLPVALPNAPAFRGLVLYSQGAVFDPASAGSLSSSRGLTMRLGD